MMRTIAITSLVLGVAYAFWVQRVAVVEEVEEVEEVALFGIMVVLYLILGQHYLP